MEIVISRALAVEIPRRLGGVFVGWRWTTAAVASIRRDVREDGLTVAVPRPPSVSAGTLRGTRIALRINRASCLERSLVFQRWWAAKGVALDVIVGVRDPRVTEGDLAHAWVEHFDLDCSDRYSEIRRVKAPEGAPPNMVSRDA